MTLTDCEETRFSPCRRYRYTLRRYLHGGSKRVCFVMLNPSSADEHTDDPTTRRAISFAERLDCGDYLAVNLFALRATDPKGLMAVDDPVGPSNNDYLLAAAEWANEIVVAWGAGGSYKSRNKEVTSLLERRRLWCLGLTKGGHPRFPLYLAKDTAFEIYERAQ